MHPLFPEHLHAFKRKLLGPMPGIKAQLGMCPNPRPGHQAYFEVEDTCLKAGVLVLLYPRENRLHLVFTRRTDKVDFHKGQISFPGGRQEAGEGLEQAALREAQEELKVDPESVRILGMLTPLYIPPSNYCIYPVVALTENRPDFQPSQIEVAEVLEIPLDHLLSPQNVQREMWTIKKTEVEVPFYRFGEHKIWGATAMVLAELLEVVKEINSR
ncbi:MAG: CoA pyrophosphatase [Candidatus Aminicenantes bacterium]|nr:MAG: CoA pyrophosphatase [Candidatus Aminicenantes bacterium]